MYVTNHVDIVGQLHLLWNVVLPDGLTEDMVWLVELYGDHDPTVHGLVKVIRSVGGHDDQSIVSEQY